MIPGINKRNNRKIDWKKIEKQSRTVIIIILVVVIVIFSFSYYAVYEHNKIRETVSVNSKIANAKVISISSGKGVHDATYEFIINGETYTGNTFNDYNGIAGDQICVKYYVLNPGINLYCEETEMQSVYNDVIIFTLKIFGLFILLFFLALAWFVISKNKKFIVENTSRISNSR